MGKTEQHEEMIAIKFSIEQNREKNKWSKDVGFLVGSRVAPRPSHRSKVHLQWLSEGVLSNSDVYLL
jgi:hypothetical protein